VSEKPLIVHVLYRLDTGGMEQVAISVINHSGKRYRHAIVALAGIGAMRNRIADPAVPCLSLDKKAGKDWGCYFRLWKVLRRLKPDIVQTYNIGTLDVAPVAWLAGVRRVVHAEHGRDVADPDGTNRRYRTMRRWLQPFIARYVAVSADLENWLRERVGIASRKVACIPNGIDIERYAGAAGSRELRPLLGAFAPPGTFVVVNVGRLDPVKGQAGLIAAFKLLCDSSPATAARLRLVIVGEGACRNSLEAHIARLGLHDQVCLLGDRKDVPAILAECDVFALSSVAEGIPLTLLEAMAAGLPIVATRVGGVGEVVLDGVTGTLVEPGNPAVLAQALRGYMEDALRRAQHGEAGRQRVEQHFSLAAMLAGYTSLYDEVLARRDQASSPRASIGFAERRER
jgi:sugar transferase (PEP-CTERM/EpsH1 system associated)